jgi:hypothetical protein
MIGLSEELPITLIIGMPLMLSVDAVHNVYKCTVRSELFKVTWDCKLNRPGKRLLSSLDDKPDAESRVLTATRSDLEVGITPLDF